ncbi:sterigmatocystin biosynthesis protein stcO [Aspergillus bombycis]|uniref:Sterigmatocystin biosynthesis protein stcO n=1 Tax=Aspergillus bombycis TaxID=109264 RepID=A0A1F8A7Z9_9EURO|nr:sterigmatocystin biosynthesis protein stcO [Aspergillus bombycis]OGM47485.1 sterigmatocystin biosynthesis protein stcO [Aspergillus bombycis]
MATYALLGATGATGSSILRHLLRTSPNSLRIQILVRSKAKLLRAFPDLETTRNPQVHVIQGTSTDSEALCECLRNASIAFMCVAQNGSPIGTTLCQDTGRAIISALQRQQQVEGANYQPCTIVQLRSASLNPALAAQVPAFVHRIVSFCLFANYADIKQACQYYSEAQKQGTLQCILVDPPTLHDADGTQITGYRLISTESQAIALSYADLGAAMCEIAHRQDEFHGRAVGVTATGRVRQTWGVLLRHLLEGGSSHLMEKMVKGKVVVGVIGAFLVVIGVSVVIILGPAR